MKLLHLDSSILGANSVSRQLSAAVVERLRGPGVEVTYRDLVATPPAHLTGTYLMAQAAETDHEPALAADLALGTTLLDEFLAADVVVVGAALYNFTVASQLKAWVDRVLIVGKTFRYTATGPEGLAGGKRVILAVASGGVYAPGAPAAAFEHCQTYLRTVFGFMGVTNVEAVVAEGLAIGPDQRAAAIAAALEQIAALPVA